MSTQYIVHFSAGESYGDQYFSNLNCAEEFAAEMEMKGYTVEIEIQPVSIDEV